MALLSRDAGTVPIGMHEIALASLAKVLKTL